MRWLSSGNDKRGVDGCQTPVLRSTARRWLADWPLEKVKVELRKETMAQPLDPSTILGGMAPGSTTSTTTLGAWPHGFLPFIMGSE